MEILSDFVTVNVALGDNNLNESLSSNLSFGTFLSRNTTKVLPNLWPVANKRKQN